MRTKAIQAIVAILVLFLAIWFFVKGNHKNSVEQYSILFAPLSDESRSKLPENFPRQFIIGDDQHVPEIISGISRDVFEGQMNQTKMSVLYQVSMSTDEVFKRYQDYSSKTFWEITDESASKNTFTLKRGQRVLQVNIMEIPKTTSTSQIQLTYYVPKI